jgi:hypothetical protein
VRPASLARSLFSSGAKVVFFTLLTAGFLLSDSIRTSLKRNRTVAMKHKQFVKLFEVSQEEEILYGTMSLLPPLAICRARFRVCQFLNFQTELDLIRVGIWSFCSYLRLIYF